MGAELLVITNSVEGDPIRSYYRSLPDEAGYEVFEDYTDDTLGSLGWRSPKCTAVIVREGQVACIVTVAMP